MDEHGEDEQEKGVCSCHFHPHNGYDGTLNACTIINTTTTIIIIIVINTIFTMIMTMIMLP